MVAIPGLDPSQDKKNLSLKIRCTETMVGLGKLNDSVTRCWNKNEPNCPQKVAQKSPQKFFT